MELSRDHPELPNQIHVCILFRAHNTLSYILSVFLNLQTRNVGDLIHAKQPGSTWCVWTMYFKCTPGKRWAPSLVCPSSSHTSARSLHTRLLKNFKERLAPKIASQLLSPEVASSFSFVKLIIIGYHRRLLRVPWTARRAIPSGRTVNPKGNQPQIFNGRFDAEAPILWPAYAKSPLTGKDPDARKE